LPLLRGGGRAYHAIAGYFIDECQRCRSKYVRNIPSEAELSRYYASYYAGGERFAPSKRLSKRLSNAYRAWRIAGWVPKQGERVLEIGFGEGHLLRALVRKPALKVFGIEYAANTVEYHRSLGIDVRRTSLPEAGFSEGFFDMVVGLHVLEHTQNPHHFVAEIFRILRPGGRLFFVVPCATHYLAKWSGKDWKHFGPPGHLWYFSTHGMKEFLQRAGFRVVFANNFSNRAHLRVLAEKPK
jgi:2-polyprenyl-3-methyl-5-hydroxy-6-metoxy-1,4-benzoquinol methylase